MEFLKNNRRFSFRYGEKDGFEIPHTVKETSEYNILTTEYIFEGGLKITNVAKKYDDFGAYEWVNYIENTGDVPTDIISDLSDCDITLPIGHEEPYRGEAYLYDNDTATRVYTPLGSTSTFDDFSMNTDIITDHKRPYHLTTNKRLFYSNTGGRSSDVRAPFFNIHKMGSGYFFAVGWTGQWNVELFRKEDHFTFKSKIEDTHFRVLPREKFRTSSIVVMPYECDVPTSFNKWRRLVKTYFSLIGKQGRESYGSLYTSLWGGMSTASCLERIAKIDSLGLPFEYIWMDAGWYGIDTPATPDDHHPEWSKHTGDWRVSPLIHPDGLKDVSKAVHDTGRKFLLWVEPERVVNGTPITSEHPEYFLTWDGDKNNLLLNLGNENAYYYCFETLSSLIKSIGIDCYRQDFNFRPLSFWKNADSDDRRGISEIKHINGLYRLWDSLLREFPHLMIDNCAAGGRRIDIETLRRSTPLWRSDYQCSANADERGHQLHGLSFSYWLPYSGTSTCRGYDEYRMRSAYSPCMTSNHAFSEKEGFCENEGEAEFLKKYLDEYLKVRPYLTEDFYPLSEYNEGLDTWCGMQFHRPSENDGIIRLYRREKSPHKTAVYNLYAINKNADYLISDADGGEYKISGKELSEKGFEVTINQKRKAKLFFYKEI